MVGAQQNLIPTLQRDPCLTLFANLLPTAALADGKNQLNRVAVDDSKESWISHQQVTPFLMSF